MRYTDIDQSTWLDERYPEDIREFMREHGAVEYLSFLSQEPRRFVEMQEELDFGDGTLTELHTRAEGLQLIIVGQEKRDGVYYRYHKLSPMGERVVHQMQKMGVTQRHERLRTIRREFENAKEDYLEFVEDPDGLIVEITEYLEMLDSDY